MAYWQPQWYMQTDLSNVASGHWQQHWLLATAMVCRMLPRDTRNNNGLSNVASGYWQQQCVPPRSLAALQTIEDVTASAKHPWMHQRLQCVTE